MGRGFPIEAQILLCWNRKRVCNLALLARLLGSMQPPIDDRDRRSLPSRKLDKKCNNFYISLYLVLALLKCNKILKDSETNRGELSIEWYYTLADSFCAKKFGLKIQAKHSLKTKLYSGLTSPRGSDWQRLLRRF